MRVTIIALIVGIAALGLASFATFIALDNEGDAGNVPIVDLDILELYARIDYQECVREADVEEAEARWRQVEVYAQFLVGDRTYAEYTDVYREVYLAAHDHYLSGLEACWTVYLNEGQAGWPSE